jgi:hypothetical protein
VVRGLAAGGGDTRGDRHVLREAMAAGPADGSIRWIVHDTATVHAAVIDLRSVPPSSPSTNNSQ